MVWSFDRDGTWQNKWYLPQGNYQEASPEEGFRAVYAPEIQQINSNFYITASISWPAQNKEEESSYTCLLKSTTGKPEGPYVDAAAAPSPGASTPACSSTTTAPSTMSGRTAALPG